MYHDAVLRDQRWEVGSLSSCFLCLRDPIWSSTYISSPQAPSMSQILSKTKHRKSIFAPLLKQSNIEEFAGSLSLCTKLLCHWWGSPVHGGCRKCHIAFGGVLCLKELLQTPHCCWGVSCPRGLLQTSHCHWVGESPVYRGCSKHFCRIRSNPLCLWGRHTLLVQPLEMWKPRVSHTRAHSQCTRLSLPYLRHFLFLIPGLPEPFPRAGLPDCVLLVHYYTVNGWFHIIKEAIHRD